jgi:hypothetical protein
VPPATTREPCRDAWYRNYMLPRVAWLIAGWIVAGTCLFVAGWKAGGTRTEKQVWPLVEGQAAETSIEISVRSLPWAACARAGDEVPVSFTMRNLTSAPVALLRESYPSSFVIIRDESGKVVAEPSGMRCGSWDPLDLSDFVLLGPDDEMYVQGHSPSTLFLAPGKYTAELIYDVWDAPWLVDPSRRGRPLSDLERRLFAAAPRGRIVSKRVPFTLVGRSEECPQ